MTGHDQPLDLLLCTREPIHIPGLLQPHGMLLAVGDDGIISHASENLNVPLCKSGGAALGCPLTEILGSDLTDMVMATADVPLVHLQEPLFVGLLQDGDGARPVMISTHRHDERTIIDFEPAKSDDKGAAPPLNWCYQLQRDLLQATGTDQIAERLARSVHAVTHYDQVMVYEFDRDWHGHVVAEAGAPGLSKSYLGLHFPASDIPPQARQLYHRQLLRIVVDSQATGVAVLGSPGTRPLDMSFSVVRSVSPLHLEYLRNMGVRASLVASILVGDQLWGLLVGHQYYGPWMPSTHDRKVFSMGTILAGGVLARMPLATTMVMTEAVDRSIERIAGRMVTLGRAHAVVEEFPILAETLGLDGMAVQIGGELVVAGAPMDLHNASNSAIKDLLVDRFPENVLGDSPAVDGIVGGYLFHINDESSDIVVLGRAEQTRVVHWGGNPEKQLVAAEGAAGPLRPRASFELWRETIRGRSRDFSQAETAAIRAFRHKLSKLIQAETERLRAERARQTERLATIGRLAGGVAHDLNNLLGVVSLNLDGVLESPSVEDADACVHRALQAVQTGAQITSSLLSFARKQPMQLSDIKADIFLPEFAGMVTALLADGISLRLDLSIDVGLFRADPAQLQTALLNLTLNARDSMKLTAGVVTISACNLKTSTSVVGLGHDIPAGDYVALSISDQGLGMSAEVLRQATEPFFTTKPSGEGTGLGLPMVVGFAAQSGGTLTINSSPGNGTTATILLPRIENSRLPPGANSVVQPTSMLSGLRLLMVEDRADLTAVLTTSCRRVGLRVTAATTAEEAIGLLTSHTYDLVLSDVQLSGPGSGLDVLAHAQSLQPPIPVMLMSGFAGAAEDEELALQNHRVLRKPFRSKALMDALAELVVLG